MGRLRLAVGAVVLAVAVTGCQKTTADPTVSTTVSPSVSVSPSASVSSGTPTPSKIAGYDAAKVAEAEKIFKEFEAQLLTVQASGGSAALPPTLSAISSAPLSTETQQLLAKQKIDGWRLGTPGPVFTIDGPVAGLSHGGSEVVLRGCSDGTKTPVLVGEKVIGKAEAISYLAYFKTINGSLKYFYVMNKTVSSCA